ncbi:MAG: hypothetical protein VW378_03405 [bacterium]
MSELRPAVARTSNPNLRIPNKTISDLFSPSKETSTKPDLKQNPTYSPPVSPVKEFEDILAPPAHHKALFEPIAELSETNPTKPQTASRPKNTWDSAILSEILLDHNKDNLTLEAIAKILGCSPDIESILTEMQKNATPPLKILADTYRSLRSQIPYKIESATGRKECFLNALKTPETETWYKLLERIKNPMLHHIVAQTTLKQQPEIKTLQDLVGESSIWSFLFTHLGCQKRPDDKAVKTATQLHITPNGNTTPTSKSLQTCMSNLSAPELLAAMIEITAINCQNPKQAALNWFENHMFMIQDTEIKDFGHFVAIDPSSGEVLQEPYRHYWLETTKTSPIIQCSPCENEIVIIIPPNLPIRARKKLQKNVENLLGNLINITQFKNKLDKLPPTEIQDAEEIHVSLKPTETKAALTIQATIRKQQAQKKYYEQKKAALTIQAAKRANQEAKQKKQARLSLSELRTNTST